MSERVSCASCGRQAPAPPLTWSLRHSERGPVWLCERCTRDQLRGIEGRLDPW